MSKFFNQSNKRRTKAIICACILLLNLLFLVSCGDADRDKDGVPDPKDGCPDTYAKTKSGCPVVERQIDNIHFYIDNSASMGGYFRRDAQFNEIVSDITAKIDREIKPVNIAFLAETIIPYSKTVQQFSEDIARTPPANQRSSQLHTMIQEIAEHNDSNDVSLLVSDCILSFPDEDIKANPEINRDRAPSTLKNNIYQSFYDLKKKDIATSVYAFKSRFYGTYYDYHNGKKVLAGESRPFYVWVIANKELLQKFNAKLADISSFQPEQSFHFGLTEEPVRQYDVLSQVERKGNWMWSKDEQTLQEINIKEDEQQFCIALNLDKLPFYVRAGAYLKEHLHIEAKGCEIALEDIKDKTSVDQTKLKSNSQKKTFAEASHFIILKIKTMNLPEASVGVSLPLKYDDWYLGWSCMDDTVTDSLRNKTFALQYLIEGVKEAYNTKSKSYIEFIVNLKR